MTELGIWEMCML